MGGEVVREEDSPAARRIRATQKLVDHMGFCWRHPSLTAIEVAWRWIFGVPFLLVCWGQVQQILVRVPPSSAGLDRLSFQNPWVSSVILAEAVGVYRPTVFEALRLLLPVAVVVWAIASGVGRTLVLWRMERVDAAETGTPGCSLSFLSRKIPGVIVLQGLWLVALLGCFWLWYCAAGWAAETHLLSGAEPDLVGYLCWLIFLSLGVFVVWAAVSWTLAIAPLIYLLERSSIAGALGRSFRLGKGLSSKLAEVNLVLAIVKIALIVLAMVFSAAPLPFSDEFGPQAMHGLYVVIAIAFLIGNDYFHVVRLRSYAALWRVYRRN